MLNCDKILLRPHHLLCTEFFEGKGYSGDFVRNMSENIRFLTDSDPVVTLTAGTDIFCGHCPENINRKCSSHEKSGRYDRDVLEICGFSEGDEMPFSSAKYAARLLILQKGRLAEICGDCRWYDICGEKADK